MTYVATDTTHSLMVILTGRWNKAVFGDTGQKLDAVVESFQEVSVVVIKVSTPVEIHSEILVGFDNLNFEMAKMLVFRFHAVERVVFVCCEVVFPVSGYVNWHNFTLLQA